MNGLKMFKPFCTQLLGRQSVEIRYFLGIFVAFFTLYFRCLMIQVLTFGHPQICSNLPNRGSSCCSLSSLKQKSSTFQIWFFNDQDTFLVIVAIVEIFSQLITTQHVATPASNFDTMSNMRVSISDLGRLGYGNNPQVLLLKPFWCRWPPSLLLGFLYVFITLKVKRVLGSSCGYGLVSCSYVWS